MYEMVTKVFYSKWKTNYRSFFDS